MDPAVPARCQGIKILVGVSVDKAHTGLQRHAKVLFPSGAYFEFGQTVAFIVIIIMGIE